MATKLFITDATGVRRQLKALHVTDALGVRRALKKAYITDASGVRRLVFNAFAITLVGGAISDTIPYDPPFQTGGTTAGIQFNADGSALALAPWTGNYPWTNWGSPTTPGIGVGYWIRADVQSGSGYGGSSFGQWLQLNAQRSWWISTTGGNSNSGQIQVRIADNALGNSPLATVLFDLTATSSL